MKFASDTQHRRKKKVNLRARNTKRKKGKIVLFVSFESSCSSVNPVDM